MELEAPPSDTRQQLKRMSLDGQWGELLEACEAAMALPCAMAWLDLQRYAVKACQESGGDYEAVGTAIRSCLRALLAQVPTLPQTSFLDDTAVANAETIAWLQEISESSQQQPSEDTSAPPPSLDETPSAPTAEPAPDARKLAMQAARSGRMQEAMEILTQEIAQERSGRARFGKRMQLAGVCLSTGHESIAYPILKELAQEIERRKLEEWETPASLANSLALLFRCLNKMGGDAAEKEEIYQRICRLDPVQALACLK